MPRYEGKNAVITGGSSGIGLAIAERLSAEGARVLVTGRGERGLDAAQKRLGSRAITTRSDSGSLADIDALANRVQTELGVLDALFVNAGVNHFIPLADMTESAFDDVLAANAKGGYFTVQKLAPTMSAGSGVVLTTSVANVKGIPLISAYSASKAALRSMARSLARELLPSLIRVNAVSPGPIDTGILERSMPAKAAAHTKADMTAGNPMSRFGTPQEVATAALFLAFDATYTTGAELPVDGGASQL